MDYELFKREQIFDEKIDYFYTHSAIKNNHVIHQHDFIEFFFITKGSSKHWINDNIETLNKNSARLLTLNDIHGLIEQNDDLVHRDILFSVDFFKSVCQTFSQDFFDKLMNDEYPLSIELTDSENKEFENICAYITAHIENDDISIWIKMLANKIISLILANSIKGNDNQPSWVSSLLTAFNNLDLYNYSFKKVLEKFDYSHEYMCRTFKKYTGYTMIEYFNKKRLEVAYDKLKNTDLSVEEICEILNMKNLCHFYELFKKEYNIKPSKLRKH